MSAKAILTFGLIVTGMTLAGGCSRKTVGVPDGSVDPVPRLERADVPTLVSALGDEDADVRFAAVIDLAGYKDQAAPAVASLRKLLKDPRENMRSAAADTLGLIGTRCSPRRAM